METYFIKITVSPLPENPLVSKVESAQVHFWIVDSSQEGALNRATRYLESYRWQMESIDSGPVAVTAADFATQEEGLKGWWKAKQKGFAAHFAAKPKAGVELQK
jgi:hypothetical protein